MRVPEKVVAMSPNGRLREFLEGPATTRIEYQTRRSNLVIRDQQEVVRCLAICHECPELQGDWCGELLRRRKNVRCGCYLPIKTKIKWFHCPQGKW